ncbi:MAG TPA: hypothetical protein VH255_07200 [Verrucomicrobiae bacterium]|nr:hypothetical protein [Verrucomicrobiae bacterium]
MSTATYTFIHVLISLVGIGSGLIVMFGFLAGKRMNGMTGLFLLTTVLTSVTGFGFPMDHGFTPGDKLGVISLVILAIAIPARYIFQMRGAWRWVYVVTASIALYLNVFVLVVQLFEKVPAIKALAPTQKEAPFAIAQLTVLLIFVVLTIFAVRKFHPDSAGAQSTRLAA